MRVLFIENDDSFSWNVVDSLPVGREDVLILSGRDASRAQESMASADVVIVGPGPKDPVRAGVVDVVRCAASLGKPLLGVCLGHQALGLAFGAQLVRVAPVHGKRVTVRFETSRLFPRFRGPETVMRYNSLALADVAPPLRVVARGEDGVAMVIEHDALPMAGLQFHPDSFGSPHGKQMVADFFRAVT